MRGMRIGEDTLAVFDGEFDLEMVLLVVVVIRTARIERERSSSAYGEVCSKRRACRCRYGGRSF